MFTKRPIGQRMLAVSMLTVCVLAVDVLAGMLAVVVVSFGMIFCLQIVRFSCLLKRRNGPMDGPTDGPTDLPTDRPSYRDARTHLKKGYLLG